MGEVRDGRLSTPQRTRASGGGTERGEGRLLRLVRRSRGESDAGLTVLARREEQEWGVRSSDVGGWRERWLGPLCSFGGLCACYRAIERERGRG